jgi:ribose 5-phosphate isomerase B
VDTASPSPGILAPASAHGQIGIAADHGGFELKGYILARFHAAGRSVVDFGAAEFVPGDDFPDFVIPLARAVAAGTLSRGIAICGSGVGAAIAANKVAGARACLIHETFSAHQGVEDDAMNILCLGGLTVGHALAWELVETFLAASYMGSERFARRLAKVEELER